MKVSRFSDAQIIHIVPQSERGEQPIGALCREHGSSEQTFYRWRKKFGGMTIPDAQRLRELEQAERSPETPAGRAGSRSRCAEGVTGKKIVTLAARREGVRFLVARGISPRRACILRQVHRSTLDYQPRPDRHALLAAQVHELARRYPRYGYRAGVGVAPTSGSAGE